MKRIGLLTICIWITISCCTHKKGTDPVVHITDTGNRYHTGVCRYLGKSELPVSLTEACKRGYDPCSECNPPLCKIPAVVKDTIVLPQKTNPTMEKQHTATAAVRCSGITKKGKQCKRMTKDADGRCFQHKK